MAKHMHTPSSDGALFRTWHEGSPEGTQVNVLATQDPLREVCELGVERWQGQHRAGGTGDDVS